MIDSVDKATAWDAISKKNDEIEMYKKMYEDEVAKLWRTETKLLISKAEIDQLRWQLVSARELAHILAELIIAYQDADSPAIQDTLRRGRSVIAEFSLIDDHQQKCSRCGSVGDTYVLCSGCGNPLTSAQREGK